MTQINYSKSSKYTDLDTIYAQCSGPGGLKLSDFMAQKMGIRPDTRLLDVGCNRGVQACFLAKEYGVSVFGIDPWDDRMDGRPMVEHAQANAQQWGVENLVLTQKIGVPETHLASESFDFATSTTALEMVRGISGEEGYIECLKEIRRVLKPGGIFALGEPMHLDVPLPEDLEPYVSQPEFPWKECFRTVDSTVADLKLAGFEIVESGYAPDAWDWWMEFAKHDPFCKKDPDDDPKTLAVDNGRWTSFGYIIAKK
ncbi:SAM-dependent methyltransferase [Maridesulfovibrio salexigens]|uniref:Methyltransferase type 11 n=1 Tax=Maridesulfovibrio salexigens (strain ATCC 14822 / DSM 2638 / NCIMB 8403 / VKM B-1763) TaxID=526222 RepID=C6C0I7_MARSD|nr:class I SAM-dependent methyltransferase [Maridesulfovibrio salexigens]ACS79121.1 Methyltransferase type 11 [Maridesulfovibrio salexigens DSM 2638]